jgi:hypothetical protein
MISLLSVITLVSCKAKLDATYSKKPAAIEAIPAPFQPTPEIIKQVIAAYPSQLTTLENNAITIEPINNKNPEALSNLSVSKISKAAHGLIEQIDGNKLRYTPNRFYVGTEKFTYTASNKKNDLFLCWRE